MTESTTRAPRTHARPPGTRALYVALPAHLAEALRLAAFQRRTTQTQIVVDALTRELTAEPGAREQSQ